MALQLTYLLYEKVKEGYNVIIKLGVNYHLLVFRENILSQFCHFIESHIEVFVKVLEIKSSFAFQLGIDK